MARKATSISKRTKAKVRTTTLGKRLGRAPAKLASKKTVVRARKVTGIRAAARKAA